MTQEQKTKIGEHFDELHALVSDCGFNVPNDINDALRAAYLAGADYALYIYRPRWISVEDELPNEDGMYIFLQCGIIYTAMYYKSIGLHRDVTHWCYLPQLPVLSNSSNTGKDLKGGGE